MDAEMSDIEKARAIDSAGNFKYVRTANGWEVRNEVGRVVSGLGLPTYFGDPVSARLYDIQAYLAKTLDNIEGGNYSWTGAEAEAFIREALEIAGGTVVPGTP